MPPKILHLAPDYYGKPLDEPDAPLQEYVPHPHLLNAARLAYALGRPLLLTGEPALAAKLDQRSGHSRSTA